MNQELLITDGQRERRANLLRQTNVKPDDDLIFDTVGAIVVGKAPFCRGM